MPSYYDWYFKLFLKGDEMYLGIDGQLNELNDLSISLEHHIAEFDRYMANEDYVTALENISISFEDNNDFVATGTHSRTGVVAKGLANKSLNGLKNGGRHLLEVGKNIGSGKYDIIGKAKAFMEKLTTLINTISTTIGKVMATGYPLMGTIKQKAINIKESLREGRQEKDGGMVKVGRSQSFFTIGDEIANPPEMIKNLNSVIGITKAVLSDNKLKQFKEMSADVLEPYRDSIKSTKVDTIVMLMGVMSLLANPGKPAGATLKRIAGAANPQLGENLDRAATAAGAVASGVYGGVAGLVLATAGSGASTLNQMELGKLDISAIPKFHPIYPFCDREVDSESDYTVRFNSPIMLGNRYWSVSDYIDKIDSSTKGKIGQVGGRLEKTKDQVETRELPAFNTAQVVAICDIVETLMETAAAYCKQWPKYSKVYNDEYRRISEIVMTHSDDKGDGKRSATAHYVRYSYRNAMSVMLASIWKNCFGADNQFIRYIVSLCRHLLVYCDKSISTKD